MMPRVAAMKTVLRCADFTRSRTFYAQVLGFTVVEEWREEQGRGCVFAPGAGTALFEVYEMTPKDPRFQEAFRKPVESDKVDLQLRTTDLNEWVHYLGGRYDFMGPEVTPWGHRWIRLRDPDGLLIAIYEIPDPTNGHAGPG